MITQQDLDLLTRLHTPLAKILLKHLLEDDELDTEFASLKSDYKVLQEIKNQKINRILGLKEINQDLRKKLDSTKKNEDKLIAEHIRKDKRIHVLCTANRLLKEEVDESNKKLASTRKELDFLKVHYTNLEKTNQALEQKNHTLYVHKETLKCLNLTLL